MLRPGGKLVVTMIGKLIGTVGHAIWWYARASRDQDEELMASIRRTSWRSLARPDLSMSTSMALFMG